MGLVHPHILHILEGLDDMAHNRLYHYKGKKLVKVKNYGLRNIKETCYCKALAQHRKRCKR